MEHPNARSLKVIVIYPPAAKPYEEAADRNDTVGALKNRVLTAFGLSESTSPDGSAQTFTLFHGRDQLETPSATLGSVAGTRPVLELKLVQQVTQGNGH